MLKVVAQIECVIDGKIGRFILDQDTPTIVAKEMCFQFQKIIGQIEDNIKAQQEAAKAAEQPAEETKLEEPKTLEA